MNEEKDGTSNGEGNMLENEEEEEEEKEDKNNEESGKEDN